MKKHVGLLTIALTVLFALATVVITVTTYAQRDQVVMTEEIVFGDKALVSDVLLTHHTTMKNRLVWHTTVPLWDMAQSTTDFQASRTYIDSPSQSSERMDVDFILNLGGSTSGTYDFTDPDCNMSSFPLEMLQDVASRAPLNSTYTETVRVADYGDVYTPEVSVNFPDDSMKGYYYFSRHTAEDNGLTDYFAIPIRDNDMATVTMTSDGLGVHEIHLELIDDSGLKKQGSSVFNGTDAFYAAMSDATNTTIHCITFAVPEDGNIAEVAAMEEVLTLPQPSDGQGLVKRDNQNQLLIFTPGEIHIFDMDTNTVIQTIDTDGFEGWDVEQGDDYFVFLNGYTFQVYEQQNDAYALALTGDYAEHLDTEIASYDDNRTMVYTPGRLLTAARKWSWDDDDCMTMVVSMNTPDGCVFTGQYATNLQRENDSESATIQSWGSGLELLVIA